MSSKRVQPSPNTLRSDRIPPGVHKPKGKPSDTLHPVFSFKLADNRRWTLSEWSNTELSDLVDCLKLMESLEWQQIRAHRRLSWTKITDPPPCSVLQPDESMHEVAVAGPKRLFGIRRGPVFCIVWFDRNHGVLPPGKNRKR